MSPSLDESRPQRVDNYSSDAFLRCDHISLACIESLCPDRSHIRHPHEPRRHTQPRGTMSHASIQEVSDIEPAAEFADVTPALEGFT